jgi:phosphopantothenoylcysteine decarboxylase/phosphopantothenate--cysteine ligase
LSAQPKVLGSVLLIVGGGIAAFKALELVRLLRKADIGVTPLLTAGGAQFVTPLSLSVLAGQETRQALFSQDEEGAIDHIALSRAADLIVVAPATANLIARAANGHADDLAATVLLATDKPVLMAPAMNVRMWEHPAVKRNVAQLTADGVRMVGPDDGEMACGEYGPGRMAEPQAIFAAILHQFSSPSRTSSVSEATQGAGEANPEPGRSEVAAGSRLPAIAAAGMTDAGALAGKRILVTAGPTHEPLDPVRYLANRSSGRQGYAIAAALAALGAEVTLVSGPVGLPSPDGVSTVRVETAQQMLIAARAALPADAAVMVAAVADWRPAAVSDAKLKKTSGEGGSLTLVENPDILKVLSTPGPDRPRLMVGFAAETEDMAIHAAAKLAAKGCDWIVANDVSQPGVMGGDDNTVTLFTGDGLEPWPKLSKDAVAQRLALRIAAALS